MDINASVVMNVNKYKSQVYNTESLISHFSGDDYKNKEPDGCILIGTGKVYC